MDAIDDAEKLKYHKSNPDYFFLHPHEHNFKSISMGGLWITLRALKDKDIIALDSSSDLMNEKRHLEKLKNNPNLDDYFAKYILESFGVKKLPKFKEYYKEISDRLLFEKDFKGKAEHIVQRMLSYLEEQPANKEQSVEETFKNTFQNLPDKAIMDIIDISGNLSMRKEKIWELIPEIIKEYKENNTAPKNQDYFVSRLFEKLPKEYKEKKSGEYLSKDTVKRNMKEVLNDKNTDYSSFIKKQFE